MGNGKCLLHLSLALLSSVTPGNWMSRRGKSVPGSMLDASEVQRGVGLADFVYQETQSETKQIA